MIRESPVLRCPKCKREVHYIIGRVNGNASYQPCGCSAGRLVK